MRIRHKPWAKPELEACAFFVQKPDEFRGQWQSLFAQKQPLYVEMGCGKGSFIARAALDNPDKNFVAIDIKYEMLGLARRNVSRLFAENDREPSNVFLTAHNIEGINLMFSPKDEVDRIYINFCNPWPRHKHHKHRLTHPRQLVHYREFLKNGGEIHFKTDDDELFRHSIDYFKDSGFEIKYITYDLHQSGYEPNIMTEHEKMFSDEGIPIKFLIAVKLPQSTEEQKP